MIRIHLISGPRNISTALMYAFGNRSDCSIVDEPFYAVYLKKTDLIHPGREEILQTMSADPIQVQREIIFKDYATPMVFIKDMAHHLVQMDYSFLLNNKPIFLIRNIAKVIHSFAKVYETPTLQDIGIKAEWEIYNFFIEHGVQPVILDTDRLLVDPERQLRQVCSYLNIPFETAMLHWPAGARVEDGVWGKYWYKSVHQSTGFQPQKTTSTVLEPRLMTLYEEALPYYDKLLSVSL